MYFGAFLYFFVPIRWVLCYSWVGGDAMGIAENIKAKRKEAQLTQFELAQKCGMSENSLRRYEKGHRVPTVEALEKIAEALKIDVVELMGGILPPTYDVYKDGVDVIAKYSTKALHDDNMQKITKLLTTLSDKQLRQVLLFLEALTDNPEDQE
jgi:transcriptional regulator with XRE-family HTH domain